MSDDRTPIEKVRYNLEQADKARKAAASYERMHDALRRGGEHTLGTIIRSRYSIIGFGPTTKEMTLSNDESNQLGSWFYLRTREELARANAYEADSLKIGADLKPTGSGKES